MTLAEFVVKPVASWLIRGILPAQSLAVVFGPPKSGKTFVVLDLMMHAAHGMNWYGHAVSRPLRVAFLAGEGHNGFRLRLHAWIDDHEATELGDFRVLSEALSLPDRMSEIITLLSEHRPDVIVIDTLNAYFGTGDENSTRDMTLFVSALRAMQNALDCAIVLVHHTGLADPRRERGSVVLRGAADVVIQVAKDEGGTEILGFQVVVARDIEEWEQAISLKLRLVETDWFDERGDPLITCVLEPSDVPVTLAGRGRKLTEAQRLTIKVVRDLAREKGSGTDRVSLSCADIAKEVQQRGGNRTTAYRNLKQLAERMNWSLKPDGLLVAEAPL